MTMKPIVALSLSISFLGLVLAVSVFVPAIPQDPSYHLFVDELTIFGVANFWNVLSNLPFLLVGILGLKNLYFSPKLALESVNRLAYVLFFISVALVALGSGYYHLSPSNETLLWDRLPMTIAFMSLFSIVICEFYSIKLGRLLLWPLIACGVFTVVYWHLSELKGQGDLRYYAIVQFLPLLVIPLMLILLPSSFSHQYGYWCLLGFYVLAKLLEYFDAEVHTIVTVISGHSLKHMAAAVGIFILLDVFKRRRPICSR